MAATLSKPASSAPKPDQGHQRFSWVLRSEWTKLRSVRSTYWTLFIMVVAFVGISAAICAATAYSSPSHRPGLIDPTSISLGGLFLAQLVIGVLGVLVISSEYSTGMIRATFSAVPRRSTILAAKSFVFGVVTLVVGLVSSFVSFFLGQAILTGNVPHATLSQTGVLRAVIGGGVYLALVGLLALGLGSLVRHTAGAIAVLFGLLLVIPIVTNFLPMSFANVLDKVLPSNAGQSIFSVRQAPGFLGPWAGLGVLCAWVAGALILAVISTAQRDA